MWLFEPFALALWSAQIKQDQLSTFFLYRMIFISRDVIGTLVMCTLCNAVQYRDIQPNRKEHNHGNYNKSADNVEGRRTLNKINFRNKTFFSIHTWAPLNSFIIFLPVNKSKCHAVIVFDRQEKKVCMSLLSPTTVD